MKVTYTGPSTSGIDVVHADPDAPDANTVTHCPHGEAVELPDDVAVAQLATGVFEPGDKAATAALRRPGRPPAPAKGRGPTRTKRARRSTGGASEGSD
jgi:hypothetical protein